MPVFTVTLNPASVSVLVASDCDLPTTLGTSAVVGVDATVIVTGERRMLRREPKSDAAVVAAIEPGVIGRLRACEAGWCEAEFDGRAGWLPQDAFWGTYPAEAVE